jgi:hypothetical protein
MTQNYITSSCIITQSKVYKNGESVFTQANTDITEFLVSLYQSLNTGYARFYKMDNLSKLGWLAAEILLKNSFQKEAYQPEETGVFLSNASASLDTDIKYLQSITEIPSPSVFVYTLPSIMIGEICLRNHFKGESAFFVFEKFDADFMDQYVNNLMDRNVVESCICGWVELLRNEYKAALYLVEKNAAGNAKLFNRQNIVSLFEGENIK